MIRLLIVLLIILISTIFALADDPSPTIPLGTVSGYTDTNFGPSTSSTVRVVLASGTAVTATISGVSTLAEQVSQTTILARIVSDTDHINFLTDSIEGHLDNIDTLIYSGAVSAGVATSANQLTEINRLNQIASSTASIDTKFVLPLNIRSLTAASDTVTVSGGATLAQQLLQTTSLNLIASNTALPLNIRSLNAVSDTVSVSGVATASNQVLELLQLTAIASNTDTLENQQVSGLQKSQLVTSGGVNLAVGAGNVTSSTLRVNISDDDLLIVTTSGTTAVSAVGVTQVSTANGAAVGTISSLGSSVTLALPNGTSCTDLELTGTLSGTVTFESSLDGGATYNPRVYRSSGILNNLQTSASSFPSEWRGNSGGMSHLRVRNTAYSSGSLSVVISSSVGPCAVFLNAAIPIGGQSVGNTSFTTIASGGTYTGTFEDLTQVSSISLSLTMNQSGTLHTQFSQDGSTSLIDNTYLITSGTPFLLTTPPGGANYFRVRVDNNVGLPANMGLQTGYSATAEDIIRVPLGSTSILNDNLLTGVNKAIIAGRTTSGTYSDVTVKTGGNTPSASADNAMVVTLRDTATVQGPSGAAGIPSGGILSVQGPGTSGTVFVAPADIFTRIKQRSFFNTEEVRYDIPSNLSSGTIYVGVATASAATSAAVWSVVKTGFTSESLPLRDLFKPGVVWDSRTSTSFP